MTPKHSPALLWPHKMIHNFVYKQQHTPKYSFFSENPKNIEIQKFEPKKWFKAT